MTPRRAVFLALGATAFATVLALMIQISLLGAWGLGGRLRAVDLVPVRGVEAIKGANGTAFAFDASRGPAVAQARHLDALAKDILGFTMHAEAAADPIQLALGWRVAEDFRNATTASVRLPAGAVTRDVVVQTTGHLRWRGNLSQLAFAVEPSARPARAVPPSGNIGDGVLRLGPIEAIPANPAGAMQLLGAAWFGNERNYTRLDDTVVRVLPLAIWLAFIAIVSALALWSVARLSKMAPAARASAFRALAVSVSLLCVALTLAGNHWPGLAPPIWAGLLLALALIVLAPPGRWVAALPAALQAALRSPLRWAVVALLALLGAWLAPVVAVVALLPALTIALAQRWPTQVPVASALLALTPALWLAATAQGIVAALPALAPLTDPTRGLLAVAGSASGLPGVALGLVALHQFWPAPASAASWSRGAAAATLWAVVGATVVLATPRLALLSGESSALIALWLPALACLLLAIQPRLDAVAESMAETRVDERAKREDDLSADALSLLDSHAERVHAALGRNELGTARMALQKMTELASAARATHFARLRVALAENDLDTATAAGDRLFASPALTTAHYDALLELAHQTGRQPQVVELAPLAAASPGNRRALALAHLLLGDRARAVATLSDADPPAQFARDLAELHLLADDWQAAQQSLVHSGVSLKEPLGESYIARLGLRASGPAAFSDAIGKLALWHPQLGGAHAAMAELLLAQGNVDGGRARLLLAMKLDPALWALRARLASLPTPTAPSAPAARDTSDNAA
ncbi:MAG: hypothetical protein JNL19_05330 [Burkholderiales bacterium]|nr:hypothetical protein [Burkholderiales bacterium]